MSKQIEERVVSMQFDNSRFERNVSQSMSTLDKLKQKLNLSGASKGLESVQTAASKVNMSGLASSVDTVSSRFSALEVMGVTALANITNSAVNAGKRMLSALTIEPVMDGFNEYEMTLNAVQTTMAGTGKTAEEVEKQLKKLDDYADKTVYSSADMFNNLPKFTNAGVELETATKAMIGIANATALAGGGAQQASIAFYNLGQSIGTGYLTRMDYNSINNAGMATMEWKNAMVEAAIAQGTLTKAGEDAYKAGGKTYTLQQLFIDGLQQQWATADVLVDVFSDYGDETTEIGKKAWSAAQDVKTFSMMMESLKATAGTGWKDTWQIIFGDLEGAKKFWTGINDAISSVITKMADWRNMLLGGALNLGGVWETITGKLENSPIGKIAKVAETVKEAAKDLEYFQDIVTKVWRGDYNNHGDNPDRYDLLEKAGYDHRVVQDLVNKGYQYKLTMEDVEESHKKFGLTMEKTSEQTKETSKSVGKLTDEQLKNAGLTDEEISLYKALQKEADRLGISIDELVKNMSEKDGRSLLIDSFKNVWSGISGIFKAIGKAWQEIFNPGGVGELSVKLYGLITSLNNFTKKLRMTDETSDKLKRTFKGLFAIIDIITTIIGGPIKIAFKILTKILGAFNLNILDVTAVIGDLVVKFRDWIDRTLDFTGVCKKLAPYLERAAKAIKEWFAGMKDSKVVKAVSEYTKSAAKAVKEWFAALKDKGVLSTFVSYAKKAGAAMKEWFAALKETKLFKLLSEYLKSSADAIAKWFAGLKETDNIPKYIIQGLVNGLRSGIKMVASVIKELAIAILDTIKGILGIHSPSTAFYDIGKNIILGLFNGIKDFIVMIYDLIMSIGAKIIEIVKGLDLGSIMTGILGSGIVIGFVKIANAVEALTEPLEGVGEILKGAADVVKSFSKVLGSVGTWVKAQALKTVAISIAILVGSIALLCLLPVGKVWASIGAIAALALVLGALTFAMGKWGPKDGVQFGKMSALLLSLAASVLILGIALKVIASIKPDAMEKTLGALWNITLMLIAIMAAFKLFSKHGPGLSKAGDMLYKMAGALIVMAIVMKLLGNMKPDAIKQGELAMLGLVGIMGLMMLISKIGNAKKVGDMLMKMAGTIAILALVVKMFANMKPEAIIQGELAVAGIVGIMALLMLITKIGNFKKVGGMLAQLASAIALLGLTVAILGHMDPGAIVQGELAIAGLVVIISGLMLAVKKFGKDAAGIGKTILLISVAIALMAGVAVLLGMVSLENLAKGVAAVAILTALAAGLVYMTKYAGGNCYKSMIGIAMAIGVMAAAVAILSFIDPGKLTVATLAMSLLIGMLSMLVKATGQAAGSIAVLAIITVAMGMMGVILILLAKMPVENTLGAAAGLSLLLLTMTGMLLILSKTNASVGDALKGIIGLLALCVPLVAIAGILCMMKNVNNALTNAMALTLLATALTLLLLPLSLVGIIYAATGGIAALGLLGLLGMCVPLVAIAGILCMMKNVNNAMVNAMALTLLITAMGDVCVKLALVGPLALVGVAALTALTALIIGVGVFAVGIGALMQKFPALQSFLDTGIPVLIQLAGGIGKMIGAFVGGIMTEIATTLPIIGLCLSQFMNNAMIFITGAKMVDEKVLAGVAILAGAIIALTAADLITGVLSFLQGGSSFADLGTQLSQFMMNALPFITMAKMIDPEIMTGVKTLAEAILVLTGANMLETITKFLGGESSLANFGSQLGALGTNMKTFVTNLGTFTEDQVTTVNCAGKAIKALAEAASAIPNEGGWAAKILGDNSIGAFGSKLPQLGTDLSGFITNLGTFTSDQVTTVDCAGKAIKALADAAGEIPNEGGMWAAIVGDNSLATFGSKLPALGKNLNGFITNLGTFGEDKIATVNCAGKAIKALADAANTIPNEGGWISKIVGENSLATFGSKLPNLGKDISGFVKSLGTFGEAQIATVNSACKAIKAIVSLGKIDLGDTSSGLGRLGKVLSKFADKLASFVDKMSEIGASNIDSAVKKTKDLIDLAKTAAGTNVKSLSTFGNSLKKVATEGVKGFVKEFTGESPKSKVTKAAKTMLDAFIKAAKGKKSDVEKAFKEVAAAAAKKITEKGIISDFETAGKNCAEGFANGIKNNKSLATKAGSSLGKAALKAAKEALDENSPSKEMYKVGDFAGVGFVNALYDNVSQAYKAGTRVADSAKLGISKAVARISDIVNSDIDAQPTIRPVLDLSAVRAGAGSMNALFSGRTLSVDMAGVGSVSASMAKFQNGSDSKEIVSSIKALRKDIADMPRNSYTINGVTYDDGTNVSDAVGSLVRAIKIERRT